MSKIDNGTKVIVKPESKQGKSLPSYTGVVEDIRTGVKGLGSVEYLVRRTDFGLGTYSKWVYASFVTVSKE